MTLEQLIKNRVSLLSQVDTVNNEINKFVDGFITYIVTYWGSNVKVEKMNNFQQALDIIPMCDDEYGTVKIVTNKPNVGKFDYEGYNHIVHYSSLTGSDSKDHLLMIIKSFEQDKRNLQIEQEKRSDYDGEY